MTSFNGYTTSKNNNSKDKRPVRTKRPETAVGGSSQTVIRWKNSDSA